MTPVCWKTFFLILRPHAVVWECQFCSIIIQLNESVLTVSSDEIELQFHWHRLFSHFWYSASFQITGYGSLYHRKSLFQAKMGISGDIFNVFECKNGGESGIRTHGRVTPTQHFQCCVFDHSAISPFRIRFQNIKQNSILSSRIWKNRLFFISTVCCHNAARTLQEMLSRKRSWSLKCYPSIPAEKASAATAQYLSILWEYSETPAFQSNKPVKYPWVSCNFPRPASEEACPAPVRSLRPPSNHSGGHL